MNKKLLLLIIAVFCVGANVFAGRRGTKKLVSPVPAIENVERNLQIEREKSLAQVESFFEKAKRGLLVGVREENERSKIKNEADEAKEDTKKKVQNSYDKTLIKMKEKARDIKDYKNDPDRAMNSLLRKDIKELGRKFNKKNLYKLVTEKKKAKK